MYTDGREQYSVVGKVRSLVSLRHYSWAVTRLLVCSTQPTARRTSAISCTHNLFYFYFYSMNILPFWTDSEGNIKIWPSLVEFILKSNTTRKWSLLLVAVKNERKAIPVESAPKDAISIVGEKPLLWVLLASGHTLKYRNYVHIWWICLDLLLKGKPLFAVILWEV